MCTIRLPVNCGYYVIIFEMTIYYVSYLGNSGGGSIPNKLD